MKTKKLLVPILALTVLGFAAALNLNPVKAEEPGNHDGLIQKLVERFNLNQDEVEEVFTEVREERHQQMQSRFEERLNQLVSDGKLTEEQKQAVLAKKAELQENRPEFSTMSKEERETQRQAHQEEMEAWAKENGLDLNLVLGWGNGPKRGGFGPGKMGDNN